MAAVSVESVTIVYGDERSPRRTARVPVGNTAVIDASLEVEAGTTVALLGPSGCGKTSLLRAIAGLETPRTGRVSIGGRVVSDGRTWVKPERRNVGMVFQDGALFPHLDMATNIAFGLRGSKRSEADQRRRVDELLELVELGGLGGRLPETLSGGQQQRVALARSLAPSPSVLLLDEPFSALDAGLRVQLRANVARILRDVGVTAVFVTHDQDEAFVMGDRVAVMRDGRIEQFDTPDRVYLAPANPWIASFVGEANFLPGTVDVARGAATTALGDIPVTAAAPSSNGGDRVSVLVRPEQILVGHSETAEGRAATVTDVEYYGHDVRYELALADGATLAARTHPDVLLTRGDRVVVSYGGVATTAWHD